MRAYIFASGWANLAVMGQGTTPEFNRLSLGDRTALFSAAGMNVATGIMREDVEARPWLYPFYVLPAASMTVPGGIVLWVPVFTFCTSAVKPYAAALLSVATGTLGAAGTVAVALPALALAGKVCADHAGPWVGKVRDRMLTSVFNKNALVENHMKYIGEDAAHPGLYKVDKSALTRESMAASVHDLKAATTHTWQSFTRLIRRNP